MESKIKKVYMLYHINERKDEKLIGFLSSKEKAESIIKELENQEFIILIMKELLFFIKKNLIKK